MMRTGSAGNLSSHLADFHTYVITIELNDHAVDVLYTLGVMVRVRRFTD